MFKHILKLIWNKKRSNALLFVEIFFCFLVIFVVSAFCIKNFRAYVSPYGFETENIWLLQQSEIREMDSLEVIEMKELLKQELAAIPGVEAAGFAGYAIPFTQSMWSSGGDEMGFEFWTTFIGGDEDLADVYQMDMRAGRWFTEADLLNKYKPVVINQQISEIYFDGASMLDSIIIIDEEEYQVVGVAENIRYRDGFEDELPTTIHYVDEHDADASTLLLRVATGSGPALEEAIGRAVFNVLKTEDYTIEYMERNRLRIARQTWIPIVIFLTIGGFLVINIALGLFGVLFYTIAKRRGEIGVRRAMGAYQSEITRQFTMEIYLVALGAMLLGAILAAQLPLLGLFDNDDFAYSNIYFAILAAFSIISVVVLGCAYWPSRQGAQLHPAIALHEE